MSAPIPVVLASSDPGWPRAARVVADVLSKALGPALVAVHHIGSTAVPGLVAKPVLDLIPVATSLPALDRSRGKLEKLGFVWWGENGLAGRRYLTRDDPVTGLRTLQLHGYAEGSPQIARHVAFRDYLRAHPELVAEYAALKERCRDAHPDDSHAYSLCKSDWITTIEAEALASGAPRSS